MNCNTFISKRIAHDDTAEINAFLKFEIYERSTRLIKDFAFYLLLYGKCTWKIKFNILKYFALT